MNHKIYLTLHKKSSIILKIEKVTINNPKQMLGGTTMIISAEELRNMKKNDKKLNIFYKIHLKRVERIIKRVNRRGKTGISISVWFTNDSILELLRNKGYSAYYWRSRYSCGPHLIISW